MSSYYFKYKRIAQRSHTQLVVFYLLKDKMGTRFRI